jgi:hypothetical protein
MEYRSTNTGITISNDGLFGAGSSHGVQLRGGSTGGIVEAVGDDNNISLTIRGKGTGGVVLGNSSQSVTIGSGSGSPLKGFFTSTSTWTLAATSSGQVGEITFPSTVFDVNPGDLIGAIELWPTASTTPLAFMHYRLSTAATSRLTVAVGNIASTATSTTSGHVRVTWADLT